VPRAEIEGEMGDAHMGLQARLMSQALRKLSGAVKQSNTALIFTNQLRQKIGIMFGNPETTTGGMALRFYSSVRLDMRRVQTIKDGGEVVGNRTKVTVKKNKVAPPFRVVEFDIMYNEGISKVGDVLDMAVEEGIVEKRGSFYSYGETRLGQGRESVKGFLHENPDMALEIENQVREAAAVTLPEPETDQSKDDGAQPSSEETILELDLLKEVAKPDCNARPEDWKKGGLTSHMLLAFWS